MQIGRQRVGARARDVGEASRRLRNYDGQRVVVGIRPEDFEDAAVADRRAGRIGGCKATVRLVEALGSELMVHFGSTTPSR